MCKRLQNIKIIHQRHFPMRSINIMPLGKCINRHPRVRRLINERARYCRANGITGVGRVHHRHNLYLRKWNKEIDRTQNAVVREYWRAKIGAEQDSKSFWGLFKQYKNKIDTPMAMAARRHDRRRPFRLDTDSRRRR